MQFPAKPTCHPAAGSVFRYGNEFAWRQPKPFDKGPNTHLIHHTRTCDYCGSIHPEDLLKLIDQGATLEVADFKYGWPHKFYITAPNPLDPNTPVQMGSRSGPKTDENGKYILGADGLPERYDEPIMGTMGAHLNGKWYNEHLTDEGLDDEAFDALAGALLKLTGITFQREGGRLKWRRGPVLPPPGTTEIA